MKKIFIVAMATALLATSCQTTEIPNEGLTPIEFNTKIGKLTKAPNAVNSDVYANLKEQDFRVWAYFATANDINYNLHADYFEGSILVFDEGSGWNTEETYYWPGKDKELDIYAISSYEEDYSLKTGDNVVIDTDAKIVTITDFVVDDDADNDLMVAPVITQDQDDDKHIKPAFQHALTKVLVKFQKSSGATDSKIYIISATTSSINSKATLTVTNTLKKTQETGPTLYDATLTWGTQSTAKEYKAQYTENIVSVTAKKDDATEENYNAVELITAAEPITYGSWLLLPQENIENAYLDIEYIVDNYYVKQRINLSTETLKAWGRNQQTTYNITIAPDYILFEPDVTDWTSSNKPAEENNLQN